MVAPARHGQNLELANVEADHHVLPGSAPGQLFQNHAVDGEGRVWFALAHGDDLLQAGLQPRGCFSPRYL
jgi:hypothetical protein